MLSPSERLFFSVLGITSSNLLPTTTAIDYISELLFVQHLHPSKIRASLVYLHVASSIGKSSSAVARSIQRITGLFWDALQLQNRIPEIFGRNLSQPPSPFIILFYLAFFLHFGKPFFSVLDDLDLLNSPV